MNVEMRDWPEARAKFCRGFDPEKFLEDLHSWGWTSDMIAALEHETRRRVAANPAVPIIEHMLDGAIVVRYDRP